jgi:hypothetical protein
MISTDARLLQSSHPDHTKEEWKSLLRLMLAEVTDAS